MKELLTGIVHPVSKNGGHDEGHKYEGGSGNTYNRIVRAFRLTMSDKLSLGLFDKLRSFIF